jgi:hypothetical protein
MRSDIKGRTKFKKVALELERERGVYFNISEESNLINIFGQSVLQSNYNGLHTTRNLVLADRALHILY